MEYAAQAPELLQIFFGDAITIDEQDEEAKAALALDTSPAVLQALLTEVKALSAWDTAQVRQI
jgi:hypothetical protein